MMMMMMMMNLSFGVQTCATDEHIVAQRYPASATSVDSHRQRL